MSYYRKSEKEKNYKHTGCCQGRSFPSRYTHMSRFTAQSTDYRHKHTGCCQGRSFLSRYTHIFHFKVKNIFPHHIVNIGWCYHNLSTLHYITNMFWLFRWNICYYFHAYSLHIPSNQSLQLKYIFHLCLSYGKYFQLLRLLLQPSCLPQYLCICMSFSGLLYLHLLLSSHFSDKLKQLTTVYLNSKTYNRLFVVLSKSGSWCYQTILWSC